MKISITAMVVALTYMVPLPGTDWLKPDGWRPSRVALTVKLKFGQTLDKFTKFSRTNSARLEIIRTVYIGRLDDAPHAFPPRSEGFARMDESAPASMMDLYTEYVRLRRDGWSPEAVVKTLKADAEQLDQNWLRQLNLLVTKWESSEGVKQAPRQRPNPVPHPTTPHAGSATVIRPLSPPTGRRVYPQEGDTIVGLSDLASAGKQSCPKCGRHNEPSDYFCFACGHMLRAGLTGATKAFADKSDDQRTRWGTAYLGAASYALLVVRGGQKPIRVELGEGEITLGRTSPGNPVKPDTDLSALNAEELGVSRLHASLRRAENTVQITDLSSKNFTYLNSQRLYPRESRVLRHGDEVRLGRLPLTVIFKHSDR